MWHWYTVVIKILNIVALTITTTRLSHNPFLNMKGSIYLSPADSLFLAQVLKCLFWNKLLHNVLFVSALRIAMVHQSVRSEWKVSIIIRWIAMESCADIHDLQTMNPTDFGHFSFCASMRLIFVFFDISTIGWIALNYWNIPILWFMTRNLQNKSHSHQVPQLYFVLCWINKC